MTRAKIPEKRAPARTVVRLTIGGQTIEVDPLAVTLREQYEAKAALKAADLPGDDPLLLAGAVSWVVARRALPDLTLGDVLDGLTVGDLAGGVADPDSPEA